MNKETISEEQVLFNKLNYEEQQFILKQMRILQLCEIIEEPRDIEVCGSLFTKSEYDKLAHSEEKKIPEKLNDFTIAVGSVDESDIEEYIQKLFNQQYEIFKRINSIIDYLKSKGE